jgi:hypothetical protein
MSKEITLNRRGFLKLAGASLAAGFIGYGAGRVSRILEDYLIINAPYDGLPPEDALKATATVVINNGVDNSFEPEGIFSREVFNKVRSGTYIFNSVSGNLLLSSTAWCVKKENNFLYFATCTHGNIDNNNTPGVLQFYRPNIDSGIITARNWHMIIDNKNDLTLMKCEFSPEEVQDKESLLHKDNYSVDTDTKLLMVGYPHIFRNAEQSLNSIVLGNVINVVDKSESNDYWLASGITTYGGSGSPVAYVDENKNPVVIGVISGTTNYVITDGVLKYKKTDVLISRSLKIDAMMRELDS